MIDVQIPHIEGITILDDGDTAALDHASDSDSDSELSTPDSEVTAAAVARSQAKQQKPATNVSASQHDLHESTGPDAELQEFQNVQERREELRQQMAVTASKLLQNPEANLPTMRSLLTLAADRDTQVSCDGLSVMGVPCLS